MNRQKNKIQNRFLIHIYVRHGWMSLWLLKLHYYNHCDWVELLLLQFFLSFLFSCVSVCVYFRNAKLIFFFSFFAKIYFQFWFVIELVIVINLTGLNYRLNLVRNEYRTLFNCIDEKKVQYWNIPEREMFARTSIHVFFSPDIYRWTLWRRLPFFRNPLLINRMNCMLLNIRWNFII